MLERCLPVFVQALRLEPVRQPHLSSPVTERLEEVA
jgi:hypothetical protein